MSQDLIYNNGKCIHCHDSGYLRVVLVDFKLNGYLRTAVYDTKNKKHWQYFAENGLISAKGEELPCICLQGDAENLSRKTGKQWVKDEHRKSRVLARAIKSKHIAIEYYDQSEHVEKLNHLAKGEGYLIRSINDWPTNREELFKLIDDDNMREALTVLSKKGAMQ